MHKQAKDFLLRRLHANWIGYFEAVRLHGSLRKAATALNVSPSAVSRALKDVEDLLGETLFERGSAGLRLTAAGEAVAEHTRTVVRDLERLNGLLSDMRGLRRGHVAIGAVEATEALILESLAAIRAAHDGITADCRFLSSAKVSAEVLSGERDLGVAFNVPSVPGLRHLIDVPLPFGAVMQPAHPLAANRLLRIYDIHEAEPEIVLQDHSLATRDIVDELARQAGIELRPTITSSSAQFIVTLVQRGFGIGLRTPLGIERELEAGELVFVPLVDRKLTPPMLCVITSDARPLSRAAEAFAEALRAGAARLLARYV